MPNVSGTNKLIRETLKDRSDTGKKMMKLGAALVMMPEPVTSAAGVPLILVGKALSLRQTTTISGVYEELKQTLDDLSSSSTAQRR